MLLEALGHGILSWRKIKIAPEPFHQPHRSNLFYKKLLNWQSL